MHPRADAVEAQQAFQALTSTIAAGCDHHQLPVATRLADRVYATSDNPRGEDPLAILAEMSEGLGPDAVVEPDREQAIARALAEARPGDVVLLAGKGHETTQEIGGAALPFDDRLVAGRHVEAS